MHKFYGPVGAIFQAIGSLFSPPQQQQQQSMMQQPSANDQFGKEQAAADEAARKQRQDASQRAGARLNILADPNLSQTFGSNPVGRKNLLGNSSVS
ncbi:MAG TPA: hypothetical protein VIY48_04225 [Candidatus Paceibacterota bacterium]